MAYKSMLYVPANRLHMQEQAKGFPCDAVIFDLESSVAIEGKNVARITLSNNLVQPFPKSFLIRVNAVGTEFFRDVLSLLEHCGPQVIVLPKQTGIPCSLQDQDLMNWDLISLDRRPAAD